MWDDTQPQFQRDSRWGLFTDSLSREASDLMSANTLAACIDSLEILRVSGDDAETFLQGQTTCDFHDVTAGHWRLGAHCNAKGRIQASFRALRQNGDFLLLLPRGQGAPTRAALGKYALFSKVELTLDTELHPLALLGPDAARLSETLLGCAPGQDAYQTGTYGPVLRLRENAFLALIPGARAPELMNALKAAQVRLAGDNAWWLAEIQAGVAQIPADLNEQWIPQEINYDLINGVSFRKGCYKGQEIVARIHYRGQTKVRAHLLQIENANDASPGARILNSKGDSVGTLLQTAYVNERTVLGLAVLKTDASESESLQLEPKDDCRIRLLPIPYAITN